MKTIVYPDGGICEVSDSQAEHQLQFGARIATPAEIAAYDRAMAEDDERACMISDRIANAIDGYDRDDLGESADY